MNYPREKLYVPAQVAVILGKSEKTLANMRSRGEGPPFIKRGKTILYPVEDFERWLEEGYAPQKSERKMALALHDLGRIMIRQGMRPAEVMAMAQADVDVKAGARRIPKGKSRAARRTLHLAPDGEIREILRKRLDGGQWVFPGKKKGTHITKLNNSHTKVLAVAELNFVIYDFRRVAISTTSPLSRSSLFTS